MTHGCCSHLATSPVTSPACNRHLCSLVRHTLVRKQPFNIANKYKYKCSIPYTKAGGYNQDKLAERVARTYQAIAPLLKVHHREPHSPKLVRATTGKLLGIVRKWMVSATRVPNSLRPNRRGHGGQRIVSRRGSIDHTICSFSCKFWPQLSTVAAYICSPWLADL